MPLMSARFLKNPWVLWPVYYLLTGAFIAVLAFVNGYPLVYSDSGTYIHNAFTFEQLEDRPIGYGLIINAVTWKSTLWTVVLFQGAVTSWLLMLLVRATVQERAAWRRLHLLLVLVLVLGSSLPWYAAQIMADVFAPLVMLALYLLYSEHLRATWKRICICPVLFFFMSAHNSHFPLVAGMQGFLLLTVLLPQRFSLVQRAGFFRRWWMVNAVACGAALMIALFNYVPHDAFRLSRASNAFMAGRLCEDGIMADYLRETCPIHPHPLCAYKERLPADALNGFLWSEEGFVRGEGLTLAQADSVLRPIVVDLLSRSEYRWRYAASVVRLAGKQLLEVDAGAGLHAYSEGTSPHAHHWWRLPHERAAYEGSLQQRNAFVDLTVWNHWLAIVLVISVVVALVGLMLLRGPRASRLRQLACWVLAWILLNAVVTSALSIVDSRLQARVVWLVPMLAVLVVQGWTAARTSGNGLAGERS
jgi:hypothetical protein